MRYYEVLAWPTKPTNEDLMEWWSETEEHFTEVSVESIREVTPTQADKLLQQL